MICRECKIKNRTIASLQKLINRFSEELKECKYKLDYLINETSKIGFDAEKAIADLIAGSSLTKKGAPTDIILPNGDKMEIKFSRLNKPVDGSSTLRWSWHRVFGEKGETKDWKYLILMGEKDTRYWPIEEDGSPYLYFLLDKEIAHSVSAPENKKGHIYLTTNPQKVRSPQGRRLLQCRIGAQEIQNLFSKINSLKEEDIRRLLEKNKKIMKQDTTRPLRSEIALAKIMNNDSSDRCAMCGVSVSKRVRQYCLDHPHRFKNKIYCYVHQQHIK